MTTVNISITSDNPDLIVKVRKGIVHMLDNGLDADQDGRMYDLSLTADSDLPGEDSIVYGSEFDGAQNNFESGSPAADVLRMLIDELKRIEQDLGDESTTTDYARDIVSTLNRRFGL